MIRALAAALVASALLAAGEARACQANTTSFDRGVIIMEGDGPSYIDSFDNFARTAEPSRAVRLYPVTGPGEFDVPRYREGRRGPAVRVELARAVSSRSDGLAVVRAYGGFPVLGLINALGLGGFDVHLPPSRPVMYQMKVERTLERDRF